MSLSLHTSCRHMGNGDVAPLIHDLATRWEVGFCHFISLCLIVKCETKMQYIYVCMGVVCVRVWCVCVCVCVCVCEAVN